MDKTFLARQDFYKSAELHKTGDTAEIRLADFDFLHERLDHRFCLLGSCLIFGSDIYAAVLFDVEFRTGFRDDLIEGLSAAADDDTDLVDRDRERNDLRCILGKMFCRLIDAFCHLTQDIETAFMRLLQCSQQDISGNAMDFDIHLDGIDALCRTCDLEVHIAQCIFHALHS